ncbi:MAG: serine/threonine protein kinase [Deltaproteobacteria bacterium]|nr:serine/threonine protein kinase [Deltaproteobacteria bacterium]
MGDWGEEVQASLEVIRRLRPGGLCDIELARTPTGALRVLKTLKPEFRDRPDLANMVPREAAILERLDHPSIVRSHGVLRRDGEISLVLEYVVGWSLAAVLRHLHVRAMRLPRPLVYNVILQILEALSYLHSARDAEGMRLVTCHQDVSPGNVVVQPDGTIKLLDFGLSIRQGDDDANSPGFIRGTPGYLTPEQARGHPCDSRGDVFSAAAVAVALLGDGRSPFAGASVDEVVVATAYGRRQPIPTLLPDVPTPVTEALEAALHVDPAKRPGAGNLALDILGAIEACGESVANRADVVEHLAAVLDAPTPATHPASVVQPHAEPQSVVPDDLPELDLSEVVAVSQVEDRVEVLLDRGLDAMLARDYDKAAGIFREVLSLVPDQPMARTNLTRLETLMANHSAA